MRTERDYLGPALRARGPAELPYYERAVELFDEHIGLEDDGLFPFDQTEHRCRQAVQAAGGVFLLAEWEQQGLTLPFLPTSEQASALIEEWLDDPESGLDRSLATAFLVIIAERRVAYESAVERTRDLASMSVEVTELPDGAFVALADLLWRHRGLVGDAE